MANTTGSVLSRDELSQLVCWCANNHVLFVSDGIYHGISFGEPSHSAWEFSTEPIVINSFSKFWCMTGWRLGWMLAPAGLLDAIDALIGTMSLCPPALAQYAALHAFTDAALQSDVEVYRRNRDIVLNELHKMGIDRLAQSDGTFYVYADFGHLGEQSDEWCRRLLDDTGVAAVPGIDFDPFAWGVLRPVCLWRQHRGHRGTIETAGRVATYEVESVSTGVPACRAEFGGNEIGERVGSATPVTGRAGDGRMHY